MLGQPGANQSANTYVRRSLSSVLAHNFIRVFLWVELSCRSLQRYSLELAVHFYSYFPSFAEREESIPCDFCGYVDEELVVDTLSSPCWAVHESAFPLQHAGVPIW